MSLPSLAADRGLDGLHTSASDAAPAHQGHDGWRRPYPPGPWRVAEATLLLLLTSYLLFSALILALAGTLLTAGVCAGLATAITVFTGRLLRAGIWVSGRGLRQVRVVSTLTLRWSEIATVRTTQQPVRWLGLPRCVQGQALLVTHGQGTPPRILLTDHSADFLSRSDSFDRAADVVQAWAAAYR